MFGPTYTGGCPACSSIADGFNGFAVHLANHDVTLCAVSRAPFAKLKTYKERMGWTFPWASSYGSDFNFDYGVDLSGERQGNGRRLGYNFGKSSISSRQNDDAEDAANEAGEKIAAETGTDWATYSKEAPGMSAFVLEDGIIYH